MSEALLAVAGLLIAGGMIYLARRRADRKTGLFVKPPDNFDEAYHFFEGANAVLEKEGFFPIDLTKSRIDVQYEYGTFNTGTFWGKPYNGIRAGALWFLLSTYRHRIILYTNPQGVETFGEGRHEFLHAGLSENGIPVKLHHDWMNRKGVYL